jgi:hypothetical protein
LRPGEQIQVVFGAETASAASQALLMFGALGAMLRVFLNKYRMLVVTDQRILVLDTGKWNMTTARGVVAELPRATRLGPATGIWHKIDTGEEKLRVHRRSFKDIAAADAAVAPVTG